MFVRSFVQAREWLTDEGPMDVPTLDGWRRYNLCVFVLLSIYGNLKFDNRRWCVLVVHDSGKVRYRYCHYCAKFWGPPCTG